MSKEPSMEEILSSIKRIIAEDGEEATRAGLRGRRPTVTEPVPVSQALLDDDDDLLGELPPGDMDDDGIEEVLELTDEVEPEPVPAPVVAKAAPAKARPAQAVEQPAPVAPAPVTPASAPAAAQTPESILSVESEVAARHSLSALSSMVVKPSETGDNTLDALVRSMLRPMLKEWLDANLPELVEAMVAKEIARITGRSG